MLIQAPTHDESAGFRGSSPGHFVTVQGDDIADNNQGLIPVQDSRYRRCRVRRVLILS